MGRGDEAQSLGTLFVVFGILCLITVLILLDVDSGSSGYGFTMIFLSTFLICAGIFLILGTILLVIDSRGKQNGVSPPLS